MGGATVGVTNTTFQANTTGAYNTAIGTATMPANTTGSNNTAVGYQAAYSNTTASNNTAVGYGAAYANTTGSSITALGLNALRNNTTASNNTGVGHDALVFTTTGSGNVAVGKEALYGNTTANNNTAVGWQAGYTGTTATNNVILGSQSGYSITTGSSNTLLGVVAGYYLTTGSNNTFVGSGQSGYGAGWLMTTGSKNTILGAYSGNQGGLDIRTSSNIIVLSDGDGNPRGIFDGSGNFIVGTTSATGKLTVSTADAALIATSITASDSGYYNQVLQINCARGATTGYNLIQANNSSTVECFKVTGAGDVRNTNNSYGAISDVKVKENIVDATPKLAEMMQVKVRNYNLIGDTNKQLGVVAQELETVFPTMVDETPDRDAEGNDLGTTTKSVKYSVFVPMLIKAIQEQQAIIESLKARLDAANL
jgi:hypothetical protein